VGTRAGTDAVEKRKNLLPYREPNHGRPVRSPSLYRLFFFFTSVLDGGEWLASLSVLFDPTDSDSLCSLITIIIIISAIIIIIQFNSF
jgi:hypothetical protein